MFSVLSVLKKSFTFVGEPLCGDDAGDDGCNYQIHRRYAQQHYQETRADGYPNCLPRDVGFFQHLDARHDYQCRHARTYARKYVSYCFVFVHVAEKRRYHHYDNYRRQRCAHHRRKRTCRALDFVAGVECHVDGKHAGECLCECYRFPKFVLVHPLVAVHEGVLHHRYHRVSAAEGEGANLEE